MHNLAQATPVCIPLARQLERRIVGHLEKKKIETFILKLHNDLMQSRLWELTAGSLAASFHPTLCYSLPFLRPIALGLRYEIIRSFESFSIEHPMYVCKPMRVLGISDELQRARQLGTRTFIRYALRASGGGGGGLRFSYQRVLTASV